METIRPFVNSCKKRAGFAALVALIAAAPAWASVNITATDMGFGEVVISFDASSEPNLVRAFALDIQLDNDANIVEVTALNSDYYIHPGTIQIDAQGKVTDYGSPVAPYSDLPGGTLPGLDSNGVTIEMASLYAPVGPGSPNAPVQHGPLVSLTFTFHGNVSICHPYVCLTISGNIARAGPTGVVMESPDEVVTVNLPPPLCVQIGPVSCYAGMPDCDQWELLGAPACWCYPRQCHGDADGLMGGNVKTGFYYCGPGDLNILMSAWLVKEPPFGPGVETIPNGICADFAHDQGGSSKTGFYRVGPTDLNILIACWLVKEPGFGPGVPADCLTP
ncbi:MAG: hypothetical protein ACYSWZ_18100 [Planctomycetota bacterium]|jgi:hypothetical protein